jgi:hypothetical protein
MYERFVAARAGKPPPPLRIVFHGTDDGNIEPILANGMDPSKRGMHDGFLTRPCHVHGPGEYFVTRALMCVFFAFMDRPGRLTGRLLIFLVSEKEVLPQAPDVVVVNDVSRELPLGTVTFQMADAKVMELDEKARQAKAAAECAKPLGLAEQAMQKARIMQMLIRGDIYEASEMYEAVMRAREREGENFQSSLPLWAHELRVYLRDVERECVVALFPGVIPVRHDSRTSLFCADESFKWPPTVTDISHSMRPTPHPPVRDRKWFIRDRPPLPPPNRGCWHWLRICGAVVLGVVLLFFMPRPKEVDQPRMYANGDGTVPFGTMFALLVLWFGISVPLVFLSAQLLWLYRVSSNGVSSTLPLQKPKQEKR